jgi:copper(I)-binding protein
MRTEVDRTRPRRGVALALALAFIIVALWQGGAASGQPSTMRIDNAWTRATPAGAPVAGGYVTITNTGATVDRLIGVTSSIAERGEVHEMTPIDGMMIMRPVAGGLIINPSETVTLKPGGYHLMLTGLQSPIKPGDAVPASLVFEKAGRIDIVLKAESIGARSSASEQPAGHAHGHHSQTKE